MVSIMLDEVTPPPALANNGLVAYEKETASIESELRAIETCLTPTSAQSHQWSSLELTNVHTRLRNVRGHLVRLAQENRALATEVVTSSGAPPASLRMRQARHRHLINELFRVTAAAEQAGHQALVIAQQENPSVGAGMDQYSVHDQMYYKGDVEAGASGMLERTADIRALTKGIEELHQLFVELASVVENQQELLNVVEADIQQVQNLHKKAAKKIDIADVRRKRRQKMKWLCISFLLILFLISLIILIFVLRR